MCRPERLFRSAVVVLLGLCGSYLAAEIGVAGEFGLPLDDGWIHCAYARNLARGAGFSLASPGEWVPGSTAPLWTFLLTALFSVLGPGLLAAKLLGITCAVLALWAVARLVHAATGSATEAGCAALLLAATPRFVAGAVSGMEVPLYVALCAFGLAEHLRHRTGALLRWCTSPLLLALAGWARPELFVLVGLVALHRLGSGSTPRQGIAGALGVLVLTALCLLPYPAYHLWCYGHPLPTTFYVKAADGSLFATWRQAGPLPAVGHGIWNALREVAAFVSYVPGHLPLLAVGLWSGVARGWRAGNGVPFLAVSLVVFAAARGLLSYTGPWVQSGRYFAHAWPLVLGIALHGVAHTRALVPLAAGLLALCGAAAAMAATVLPDPGLFLWDVGAVSPALAAHEPWWIWAPGAGFLAVTLLAGNRQPAAPPRLRVFAVLCAVYLLGSHVPGVWLHGHHVLDTNTVHVAMAQEVARRVPKDARVACHDIGALGFFAPNPLIDLAGIASPEILFERRVPGAPPAVAAHLSALRPRYLCVLDGWFRKLFPDPGQVVGLKGFHELHRITHEHNVTVGGEVYYLYELQWE